MTDQCVRASLHECFTVVYNRTMPIMAMHLIGRYTFWCCSELGSWTDLISYLYKWPSWVGHQQHFLYLAIHNSSDCTKLQDDLNNLQRLESDWHMAFHPEKCEVIHISTIKTPIIHKYSLDGHILSSVSHFKYLGVQISQDLKWNTNINAVPSKANQTLGFLGEKFLRINSSTIKDRAYKSLILPKLFGP